MPKSLKNCSIENSIVEFRYQSPFHRMYIQDEIVKALNQKGIELQEYRLVNDNEESDRGQVGRKLSFFSNNEVKFLVDRQLVSFNCVSAYPGWEKFFAFITSAIKAIPDIGLQFDEVRVRYISTYKLPIFDKLDGTVSLEWFKDVGGAEIRFPIRKNNVDGLVRVTNLLKSIDGKQQTSFVDVEVGTKIIPGTKDNALSCCEAVHLEEKKNYFQLLSLDFVNELEPLY